MITPEWPAPARVRALVTTRGETLPPLPGAPAWLKQVHGTAVLEAARISGRPSADGAFTRAAGTVCAVRAADCMPVLFTDDRGTAVGAAHAGWRGLAAGVLEATLDAMRLDAERTLVWLGPAIGPGVYEVGEDVHGAFVRKDPAAEAAFRVNRPGHWLLDLYAVARQRLAGRGVTRVFGGGFCTYSDPVRFPSFRRDRTIERIAALIWLESPSP